MADITILGSGGFGLALAIMCDNAGHKVTVWSKFRDEIDAIKRTGELKAKLPWRSGEQDYRALQRI